MSVPTVVVAGTGFAAVRQYMLEAFPEVRLEMIDASKLRAEGFIADALIPAMSRIDGELMDRVRGLRLIQQWGAGLEGVDIAAATERHIAVANVPSRNGNAESVAEWCVMAAIAVSRRLPIAQQTIRNGSAWGAPIGRALMGRIAGIIGFGGIGQALAYRLRPFGMRVVAIKRTPDASLAVKFGLEWLGGPERLPELLRYSDYVFLCVPLNDDTRVLLDERAIALMPPQACIINAGRGGLLSQPALLSALEEGRLMGAGLDVFEREPLDLDSPLLNRPEVVATAHIAGVTDVSYREIARRVAENVRRVQMGQRPENCANRDDL
ncbi:MAG: NAD(P)-dependent oxidoreductase [Candidatus Binataceae bacterium]